MDRILCKRGQRKAIADSRDRLFGVALAWCGDAMVADDLVQETLILALQRVHQLRQPERLHAWLYSILSNCWKHHLRRQRPSVELEESHLPSDDGPAARTREMEIVHRVRRAIVRLPLGQQQTVTLVDLEGFSYAEVAEILDIPVGTVMSRLHTARNALQRVLVAYQSDRPEPVPYLQRVK